MSFSNMDLQRNSIAKKMGALLPQIDPHVKWADYIPGTSVRTGTPLIAIGLENGDVKYVNISKKSPFKLVNEVLNAMDDYCLDVQFLNTRQLKEISGDIATLAKDRARVASDAISMLESLDFSSKDCLEIVKKAQEMDIFPQFFPEISGPEGMNTKMLEQFLKTYAATFIDTQIIFDLVNEQVEIIKNRDAEREESYER